MSEHDKQPQLSDEELEQEIAAELPQREAMSLINPYPDPGMPVVPDTPDQAVDAFEDHKPIYTIQPVPSEETT